jgi:hypothetical protein
MIATYEPAILKQFGLPRAIRPIWAPRSSDLLRRASLSGALFINRGRRKLLL